MESVPLSAEGAMGRRIALQERYFHRKMEGVRAAKCVGTAIRRPKMLALNSRHGRVKIFRTTTPRAAIAGPEVNKNHPFVFF